MNLDDLPELMQKRSIIAMLLKLGNADSKNADIDIAYIREVCNHINLPVEDIAEVQTNLGDYPLDPPRIEEARMQMLYYLLFQMKSDQIATPEEIKFVQEFGFKLGFNELLTEEMILLIKENLTKKVPADSMVKIIRKYQN